MDTRDLPIPRPCDASWDEMEGDAVRRFCRKCEKHVHNLSALTEDEARRLLAAERPGRLCVQYAARPDGEIVFGWSAPIPLRRRPRGPAVVAGVAGSLLAACAAPADGDVAGDPYALSDDGGVADGGWMPPTDDLGFAGSPGRWDAPPPRSAGTTFAERVATHVPAVAVDIFPPKHVDTEPTGGGHNGETPTHSERKNLDPEPRFFRGAVAIDPVYEERLGKVAYVLMGEAPALDDESEDD